MLLALWRCLLPPPGDHASCTGDHTFTNDCCLLLPTVATPDGMHQGLGALSIKAVPISKPDGHPLTSNPDHSPALSTKPSRSCKEDDPATATRDLELGMLARGLHTAVLAFADGNVMAPRTLSLANMPLSPKAHTRDAVTALNAHSAALTFSRPVQPPSFAFTTEPLLFGNSTCGLTLRPPVPVDSS